MPRAAARCATTARTAGRILAALGCAIAVSLLGGGIAAIWLPWPAGVIVAIALGAAAFIVVMRGLRLLDDERRASERQTAARADGRNLLRAAVRGASIPELEATALDRARDLYGPDANLAVESVENVGTSTVGHGQFIATVYVRRLPAAAPAAAEVSIQEVSTS